MDAALAGAWLTGAFALLAVAVPALATRGGGAGGLRLVLGAAAATVLAAGVPAVLLAGWARGAAALVPLAGYAILLAGVTRLLRALRAPAAAAAALAVLLGTGLLVLPFLGDPLVEPGGPGRSSPRAVAVLLGGSPLFASVGGGLEVDLLRTPAAYGGAGGRGLSRIGAFYAHTYPDPLASGAGWGAAGLLLLWGASLRPVRGEG